MRQSEVFDVLVIGGGASGLGVALHAALQGRSVALLEARDFACGTSSRSTKLLHGGVRYLAQGRLGLVRQALRERSVVMGLAPHLAQPLPFVVAPRTWGEWGLTWLGLKAYDWLARGLSLGGTRAVSGRALRQVLPGLSAATSRAKAGVMYWDGQFDDARLALALARSAQEAGAVLCNHTEVLSVKALGSGGWVVTAHDSVRHITREWVSACVVNATGVWVDALRARSTGLADAQTPWVRPSQGVHLVVRHEVLPLDRAVLVPRTADGRVLFALPWLGATVIGTTDTPRSDAPVEPRPTREELRFLLGETRKAFGVALKPEEVSSVWVGLRPLVGAGQASKQATAALSREHLIRREAPGFVTVTGGKWTTYRAMAQEVMAVLQDHADVPAAPREVDSTHHRLFGAPAPGERAVSLQAAPGLHLLGTQAAEVAKLPGQDTDLGLGLTEALVRYCARHEWAVTCEDMLARRWRVLFLDARLAKHMAVRVAEWLRQETGVDPELEAFTALCDQYALADRADLADIFSQD